MKGRSLDKQMFVAKVIGKSMEPRIPSGSYCIFRFKPTGSFDKRVWLVQYRGPEDPVTGRTYTVKRFRRLQKETSEGLERTKIWLEPLNPAYEPIDINPKDNDAVEVVAEFKDVLG